MIDGRGAARLSAEKAAEKRVQFATLRVATLGHGSHFWLRDA